MAVTVSIFFLICIFISDCAYSKAHYLGHQNVTKNVGQYDCYGDFMKLKPTGAGEQTAKGAKLPYAGVKASQTIARRNLPAVKSLRSKLVKTGKDTCIHPALIAGLASRESNAGQGLKRCNGWGDCRAPNCKQCHAWGILQCDVEESGIGEQCRQLPWDSQALMELTISKVFVDKIKCVQRKFPNWSKEQQLQGGVAAYNFGCGNVRSWKNLDEGTAHGDYSNDAVARAQWFYHNLNW